MTDFDSILDYAFTSAGLDDGVAPATILARQAEVATRQAISDRTKRKNAPWTQADDDFLRQNYGQMSEGEIAAALGRSADAVHIRSERHLDLPRPTKDPRWITANRMAIALGVDGHKTVSWCRKGLLPAELIPSDVGRIIWRVPRREFLRWALNPASWVWFDPDKIADPNLRRLAARRKQRWGDEWWNTRRVAEYHGVDPKDVYRHIKMGKIRTAIHTQDIGGRSRASWATWHVLRSEAVSINLFRPGKGRYCVPIFVWPAGLDALVVLGTAIGLPAGVIAHLAHDDTKRMAYRSKVLITSGKAMDIARSNKLAVGSKHTESGDVLWADWWIHKDRFPCLLRAMLHFYADDWEGEKRGRSVSLDMRIARGVLASWLRYFAYTPEDMAYAQRFSKGSISAKGLREALETLHSWGLDPLGLCP